MHNTKIPFIGKNIKIIHATTQSLLGLEGEIIDETKYQFIMKTKNGMKKIDKRAITFATTHKNNKYVIEGKDVAKTVIERIKAKVK